MNLLSTIKKEKEDKITLLKIRFRYWMSMAEIFSPIIIQLIPAVLTFVSIGNLFPTLLHIDTILAWCIAGFVAIGMELLGLVSVDVYFESKSFNQTKGEHEETAPENAAFIVMMVYAVTALLIVVFLKMVPSLAIWSLIPLSLMSILIVSSVTMKKRLDELILLRENAENTVVEIPQVLNDELQNRLQLIVEKFYGVEKTAAENQQLFAAVEKIVENYTTENQQLFAELQEKINQFSTIVENQQQRKSAAVGRNQQQRKSTTVEKNRQPKINKLVQYLIGNCDGISTADLNLSQISKATGLDRTTVGKYIQQLKEEQKINGHVDAELLR